METSEVPSMHVAAQKPKPLIEVFPQRIPKESSLEAHGNSCRQQSGNNELLPVIAAPLEVGNGYYHPIRLRKEKDIDAINKLLKRKGLTYADPLLFFALQRDKPGMADKNPVVIFWQDQASGNWCHCKCGKEGEIRYIHTGLVAETYPKGTVVIASPLVPVKVFI
jgi:hypothetical protein